MNSEIFLRNDPSTLIESIRESVRRQLEEIEAQTDAEILNLENEINMEIEEFRSEQEKKYAVFSEREEGRGENVFSIKLKKQKLGIMESYISAIISVAGDAVRGDGGYSGFLARCVISAFGSIAGDAAVYLSPRDKEYVDLIMSEIRKSGFKHGVKIVEDAGIIYGGAMVADEASGVVFNNTVERIMFRNMDRIRRIIVRNINESADARSVTRE